MYTRNLFTLVLVALCALCSLSSVFAKPPAHPATDVLKVTSPHEGKVYHVGDIIHVKVELPGGKNNILYKSNVPVEMIIQKRIARPNLNIALGKVPARTLAKEGFKFVAKKEYIIPTQKTVAWRVRAHFDAPSRSGFSDSQGFHIKK
ncbi:hypothetical protein FBU30_007268 [Linnemannia zychae]|nr:hypothetical protein FBU30_007268 [Linnemannia zychae]